MKPECRRILEQLAPFSADELTPRESEALRRHLEQCPPCQGQWLLFKHTMDTLSTATQPLIEVKRSSQMWLVCLEHAREASAEARVSRSTVASRTSQSRSTPRQQPVDPSSLMERWGWLTLSPRVGWALAGGAVAVLGAAFFLAPRPANDPSSPVMQAAMPIMPDDGGGQWVHFQAPPQAASNLLAHHAALDIQPYSDPVSPAVVYYSASHTASRP